MTRDEKLALARSLGGHIEEELQPLRAATDELRKELAATQRKLALVDRRQREVTNDA